MILVCAFVLITNYVTKVITIIASLDTK